MSSTDQSTLPATRRVRKSIGAHTDIRKAADKENATMDLQSSLAASRKKSRSKSLGPGGLDALKQGHGNRRASLAAPARPPRSILKPAIAPLAEIPPPKKRGSQASQSEGNTSGSQSDDLSGSKIALRTEEEQQAAAREREERDRRDARRKSLANRRVSFAAEATLHTFHDIDYLQDSTASTDSSRRASAAANKSNGASNEYKSAPHFQAQDASEREQRDDDTATMLYSSDSEAADVVEEEIVEDDDGSSSDSDDGTMMSMVTEEVTGTSMGSDRTGAYDEEQGNSSTLDEALRLAAQRAGAQRLEQDQSSDEDDEEEVIPSFGWIKKGNQSGGNPERLSSYPDATQDLTARTDGATDMDMDMDMTNAVGRIIKSSQDQQSDQGEEDMSMDVTSALGGILSQNKPSHEAQPLADEEDAPMDEATMEFTTALGGIRNSRPGEEDEEGDELDDNEDMSMELTTVLGGVLGQKKRQSVGPPRRKSTRRMSENGDATMDMTTGLGAIVSSNIEREAEEDEGDGDATMGMDMTAAIGGILSDRHEDTPNLGQSIFRDENEEAAAPPAATQQNLLSPEKQTSPTRGSRHPSHESSSPGLSAFRGNSLRRSAGPQAVVHDAFGVDSRTPSPEKLTTPKSSTKSPQKATVSPRRGVQRMPSPQRPSATQSPMTTPKSSQGRKRKSSVFHTDQETGDRTPSVILTPRRLSGIGLDKSGLGSPRVAALFERRGSIGDSATSFIPGQRGVSFADPKVIADEIDKDRQWEQDKENSRSIMEREADGPQEDKEPTLNLREMIDSLSPKRNPLRGRKSLHVGSAAGLLGKRPFELDDDAAEESEDAEDNDGVKRLKGHQGSPVKNIKLRNPPSKAETTGRALDTNNSVPLSSPVKSPRPHIRFREVDDQPTTREVDFESSPVKDAGQLEREADDERIHLQDFLNMTSIRFMELTTTKRRHTAAPSSFKNGTLDEGEDDMSLERCVITGACTVPTLELYQHSCRELKKYISDGRRIVKEIETDTWEENPALFQEYISATPEVKALMDNQFKNVKTHARLKSKAGWYEWRTELQHGLKAGLHNIGEGMERDGQLLQKQKHLLDSVMPALAQRHKALQEEAENLEEVARELADCDPEELQSAREELADLDFDVAEKKQLIAELKQQLEESTTDVETLSSKKESCLADIVESERIREECRGWTSAEIDTFKDRVTTIERNYGWVVTGVSGTSISMTYKQQVELVYDIAAFRPNQQNQRIDLWYIADNREIKPKPKTAVHDFFLESIRDQIRALPQSQTPVAKLLSVVQAGWDKAIAVSSQMSDLNVTFPTTIFRTSDSVMSITSSLLLVPLETRVEAMLHLHNRSGGEGLEIDITAEARVIYGEHFNVGKIGEFLVTRIGNTLGAETEEWSAVMVELHQRLIARGRKQ